MSLKFLAGFMVAVGLTAASVMADGTVTVNYDPNAPTSNFGSPSNANSNVAYTIQTTTTVSDVNLIFQAQPSLGGSLNGLDFTNLYFSTDVVSGTGGSTVGFEIENNDAFIPGGSGSVSTVSDGFTVDHVAPGEWTISIPWSYFENDPDNLGFTKISATNDVVRLNLSQSFGYSVAGGQTSYGSSELGEFVLPASSTPEPSTYALVAVGLFLLYGCTRGRRAAPATKSIRYKS